MTTTMKAGLIAALIAFATALTLIIGYVQGLPVTDPSPSPLPSISASALPSPAPSPLPSASASVSPSPVPSGTVAMIGETVSFELRPASIAQAVPAVTGLQIQAYKILQINVSPLTSLKGGIPGLYDEPLLPVSSLVAGQNYWLDVTPLQSGNFSFSIGGATVSLRGLKHALPAMSSFPAYVELEPMNLLQAHGYPTSSNVSVECPLVAKYVAFLRAHRVEPINHMVSGLQLNSAGTGINLDAPYPTYGCSTRQLLLTGAIAPPMLWKNSPPSTAVLQAIQSDLVAGNLPAGSWDYACDESGCSSTTLTQLQAVRAAAPLVKNMATRSPSWSSLIDLPYPNFDSGILGAAGSYGSCTSAGTCGNGTQGVATGTPILGAIDVPRVNARAYAWVAFVSGASRELYYDSTFAIIGAWNQGGIYQFGQWGDGTLLFAGKVGFQGLSVDTAMGGIRLKQWRRGLLDLEYAIAAKAAGLTVPMPASGFKAWSKNEADYEAYKSAVAAALGW